MKLILCAPIVTFVFSVYLLAWGCQDKFVNLWWAGPTIFVAAISIVGSFFWFASICGEEATDVRPK